MKLLTTRDREWDHLSNRRTYYLLGIPVFSRLIQTRGLVP